MFDFEKLEVYQVIKNHNIKVLKFLKELSYADAQLPEQLKKETVNVLQNLVEGTGRMNDNDKKHYLTLARSSVFQCVALLELMKGLDIVTEDDYLELYNGYEQASKMLLGMYRSYASKSQ